MSESIVRRDDPLESAARKVMRHVVPVFLIMFIANYIDRVSVGFVNAHMETDLGISAAAYGLGSGLFFVGYAIFEVPSNILMQRFGARAWLTRIMLTWGIVAGAMAFVRNDTSFYVLRFLLGAAEAGFFPGIILYFAQWLPDKDRGKAAAIILSGAAVSSVIAGPLAGLLLSLHGFGVKGWQWMFLVEGGFSILLCGVCWVFLKSNIRDAHWLDDAEKDALQTYMVNEQADRERSAGSARVSKLALLKDPQIMLFCCLDFAIQMTIYAVVFWLPTIIRRIGGLTDFQVGLYNAVPWLIAIVAMYGFAVLSAKRRSQRSWVALSLVIAALGLFASASGSPMSSFIAICFAAIGFKAASSLFWPIPQGYLDARVAGGVIALINSVGNLGGFAAPTAFGFLQQHTGSVAGGLYGLAATSLIAAGACFFARSRPINRSAAASQIRGRARQAPPL